MQLFCLFRVQYSSIPAQMLIFARILPLIKSTSERKLTFASTSKAALFWYIQN